MSEQRESIFAVYMPDEGDPNGPIAWFRSITDAHDWVKAALGDNADHQINECLIGQDAKEGIALVEQLTRTIRQFIGGIRPVIDRADTYVIDRTREGQREYDAERFKPPDPVQPEHFQPMQAGLSPIATAFRASLKATLDEPFNNATLSKLERMAEAAKDWLRAETPKPEDFSGTTNIMGIPVNDPPGGGGLTGLGLAAAVDGQGLNAETFGANLLRQMIPQITKMWQAQHDDPATLVRALTEARRSGLTDIADQLEERLTGKKPEPGGPRPVLSTKEALEKEVHGYLPPQGALDPNGTTKA